MGRKKKIEKAKIEIVNYFESRDHIYSSKELYTIFDTNRYSWELAQHMGYTDFIETLLDWKTLKKHTLEFENFSSNPKRELYSKYSTDERLVMQKRYPNAYFAYYTALAYHNLTEQLPKTVYLCKEVSRHSGGIIESQQAIDQAFKKSPRISNRKIIRPNATYMYSESNYSENSGIIRREIDVNVFAKITNLERTLVDALVRPEYCGGVWEVLKAYNSAADSISINKVLAYLKKLNYIYPFHQRLGFYLTKSGNYSKKQIKLIPANSNWNFYLAHGLDNLEFDKQWKIYYPKELKL